MNKIFIYYHVFLIGNWLEIMKEQINTLIKSGLYENCCIKIGALHEPRDEEQPAILKSYLKKYDNIHIQFLKENTGFAESETLSVMKDDCDAFNKNRNILYIHTKGVTQYQTEKQTPVANWRRMMEYFLIENWKECILKLNNGYDCCGINHQTHAGNIYGEVQKIHIFNGNFFWANSDYIKKLDKKILFEHRYSSENFICSLKNNKAYSFYNTPIRINLYYESNDEYRTQE
jgi:hypothetical protein